MRAFACLFVLVLLAGSAWAEEPPAPRLDRVDYRAPENYVALGARIGAGQRTLGIAKQLSTKGGSPTRTLGQVVRWVGRNLRVSSREKPMWRTMDEVVQKGRVATEAEQAYAIGCLGRATGIPATWVKAVALTSLKAPKTAAAGTPNTRTFLEVFLDKQWRLLDPTTARLYDNYDRTRSILPGGYLAYDKGGDPFALVLDNRPDLFRTQLGKYMNAFDARRLPWATSRDLLAPWRVYITGQSGGATYAKEAARTLGFLVERKFDGRWDTNLADARGKILIVTSKGTEPVLPKALRAAWLPSGWEAAYKSAASGGKGWIAHKLADGTRVILVMVSEYGPVELAVSEALEG